MEIKLLRGIYIAVVLSRKAFSPYKYAAYPWKHASSPWKRRSFSVETRIIYVKHDTVARTGHLFSAETCSFSVQTCSFSVQTLAFSVEYLLVLYDGGRKRKSSHNATSWLVVSKAHYKVLYCNILIYILIYACCILNFSQIIVEF